MGCAVSGVQRTTMSLFGKNGSQSGDARVKLERKLYLAKESPEPDFDLAECQLRQVPSGTYSICKVYRKLNLYLQSNNLQSLEHGGQLSDLYLIKILNISENKFTQLPNDIRYLVNLTELYLQNNQLKILPESIQHLENIQIIDVSHNKLRTLTSAIGKLKNLRLLILTENKDLQELCSELCFANNLTSIELDGDQYIFPPRDIATTGTENIMRFLCEHMNVDYIPPGEATVVDTFPHAANITHDPFAKQNVMTWEEQEATITEQEKKYHEAAKQQRVKFLSKVLEEQQVLDSEIAKVHEAKEVDRQKLIKAIQNDEKVVECLIKNFIKSDHLNPETYQQQIAHEKAEHDRLLRIIHQNYDNVRKAEVLKAMESLIESDYSVQHSKKNYEDYLSHMKQSVLMQESEGTEKLSLLLKAKDQSRSVLVQQFLEDQDIQKALVASLIEKVDARSWSLNEEISLISSHLAKLSVIEQEKKKMQVAYNYNELLHQRVQLLNLLDDLLHQQNKRRNQLIETLKEMELNNTEKANDFWVKNYQKLMDSAPKQLLNIGKHLDPLFSNYLLEAGVIHCLPFLVKFLLSEESLMSITSQKLKENGVTLHTDRENIMKAINCYVGSKSQNNNFAELSVPSSAASAPPEVVPEEHNYTGMVVAGEGEETMLESECVVCMDAKCEVVFVPCGHMCCCQPCSIKELVDCPMCRATIERAIKVIMA